MYNQKRCLAVFSSVHSKSLRETSWKCSRVRIGIRPELTKFKLLGHSRILGSLFSPSCMQDPHLLEIHPQRAFMEQPDICQFKQPYE